MRPEEADTLTGWVRGLGLTPGSVCLNIGSSTKAFREQEQPHIAERFIRPLESDGIRFIHCDMKEADGVDEVGDILDPDFRSGLRRYDAALLACSNLLEHLAEPERFAKACAELVREGGYGLFSVPLSYPYHPDPIDTMLRLTPVQLAAMMPDWAVVRSGEIEAGNYWRDLRATGDGLSRLIRQIGRVALPFYRPTRWRENASRLSWLARQYRVSIVLLRKPSASETARAEAA
jgi:SAM-dependent methyltransferase